ncbi:hypothetical protein HCN44_008532 [Aphidius gifuensis]|uniref:Major facilitator superfamily domain-containing protein 12-like n=1 Tax=Aphidius gifuensis TaxID=684658 RepID=A0A834XNW1_APHGI|nr:hypothetical protein HCN44_008532 [Aphidius gifuensis]
MKHQDDSVVECTPLIDDKISIRTKLAYSLGHVFNDLAAAMWFSYTLIYLQRITLLEPLAAGFLLLLGQLVDALMTPIFGILIDKYSKKKFWHIIGSVLVAISFPTIFGSFFKSLTGLSMLLYILSIIIFQTGWAAVQISHLSMIPMLTRSPLLRADLTAIRYSAQVGSAVLVFLVTWIVLPTSEDSVVRLSEKDSYKFRELIITLATVYLPLYIEETDVGGKQALATVPLVSYLASFGAALTLKYINRSCGTKISIITEYAGNYELVVYITAILIGIASSITMVTALSVTAELIGPRTENSALVYSIVTFLDKVVTGLVVIFIERWRCEEKISCPNYNRDTLATVCAASMLLGLITLMSVARCLTS